MHRQELPEEPDLALARFTLFAVILACVVSTAVTAPVYALLDRWAGLPAPLSILCALVLW